MLSRVDRQKESRLEMNTIRLSDYIDEEIELTPTDLGDLLGSVSDGEIDTVMDAFVASSTSPNVVTWMASYLFSYVAGLDADAAAKLATPALKRFHAFCVANEKEASAKAA